MIAWPERVDHHLGRVIPGATVEDLVAEAAHWTPRHVVQILARCEEDAAYDAIVQAAWAVGITHGPPDLAGRRCPLRLSR
jgi:hypothetical protein